jgi:hypothetical protein
MRILKLAFISFLFFAALLFLMSLLIPSRVRISKAINLAYADSLVLQQVSDTSQWRRWHPLAQAGRIQQQTLVKKIETDTLVVMNLTHAAGSNITNSWALHRFGATDSLTLQWYMDFKLSYLPWHRFSSLFYEATYGRMMEQGLQNLKQQAATK